MTMVIRSLAEVLVPLKTNDNNDRVGPGFNISPAVLSLLSDPCKDRHDGMAGHELRPEFGDIDSIINRMEHWNSALRKRIECGPAPPVVDPALAEWAGDRLKYVLSNSTRIAVNLRRIYQQGIYSA